MELRTFIQERIAPIVIPDEGAQATRDRLILPDAMTVWEKAFTHPSKNPNPDENYEFLEFQGDNIMSCIFSQYIKKRFPDITESEASELKVAYLSTKEQSQMSIELGLPQFLQAEYTSILAKYDKIQEDILEAFFGALFEIAQTHIVFGYGFLCCYNLLVYIFSGINIDFKHTQGDAKTQLKEIIEKLPGGNTRTVGQMFNTFSVNIGRDKKEWKSTVKLPAIIFDRLRREFPDIPETLAQATGTTKKNAEQAATIEALNTLNDHGIDRSILQELKRNIANYVSAVDMENAKKKMQDRGFVRLYFSRPIGEIPFAQLIGIRENGRHVVIATSVQGKKTDDIYKVLIRDFIRGLYD